MDMSSAFQSVNFSAVVIAAIANILIGSLWYSPTLFGITWMKEIGYSENDLKKGLSIKVIFLFSLLFSFITAFFMAAVLGPGSTAASGVLTGAVIAVIFIGTAKANNMLHEHQSLKLFFIHSGYDLAAYLVMGAIIGGWH